MKLISSLWVLYLLRDRLASAVCECGNGQQAVIPSDITITAPRPYMNTDGSPSSFGSACMELTSDIYVCTNNTDNPLFDCNTNNNSYYGWNDTFGVTMTASFASLFQSMNVRIIFLMSTSNNASVPASLSYITSRDGMNNNGSFNIDDLPTDLPEGPYQHNFTLLPGDGMMFNQIFISIVTANNPFELVAIGRIIFCAATIEDHNVTFSSVMSTSTSLTVSTSMSATVVAAISSTTSSTVPDTVSPTMLSTASTDVSSTLLAVLSSTTTSSTASDIMSSTVFPTVSTMSHTVASVVSHIVSTTMSPANTTAVTAGAPLSSRNNSVNIGVVIGAAVGALLLIIAVLLFVIMLLYRRRQSKVDDKGVTIKMNDHDSRQHTPNTAGKSQHDHSDKDISSQAADVDPESRLERVNELYIPSKVESFNSLLDHDRSVPSVDNRDVTVTPNPSYAVSPNPPQTRKKSEQQYDYIQTDEVVQHDEYLQLVGSATSDGVYDDIVTDPASADNVNMDLNPSYAVPHGGQDVQSQVN